MDIDVFAPSALPPNLIADWMAMQRADPALDSPFLSPDWALAVERAQAGLPGAVRVAVLSEGGVSQGFFSARIRGRIALPLGAPLSDYQGLVAPPGLAFDARRLVEAFGVQRLDFSFMLDAAGPFGPHMCGEVPSYVIDLTRGYAAYELERRAAGSGVLKDIDKRRRKLEREIGPVRFTPDARDPGDFNRLKAWKKNQFRVTGQTDIFRAPWVVDVFERLLTEPQPHFGGMLSTLHVGDELAAAQFNLRGGRTIHSWIISHAPALERYSPGLVLFGEMMRWMDDSPWSLLDLGAGDYRFKLQLSNARQPVAYGFVGKPSPLALLRSAEYRVRALAERWPLGRASAWPGKAMRRLDILSGLR